jgi:hypothetical protein
MGMNHAWCVFNKRLGFTERSSMGNIKGDSDVLEVMFLEYACKPGETFEIGDKLQFLFFHPFNPNLNTQHCGARV